MADPLTALIHAVQVMNFLKTLIIKTLREREESAAMVRSLSSTAHSAKGIEICQRQDLGDHCLVRSASLDRAGTDMGEKLWKFRSKEDVKMQRRGGVTSRFSTAARRRKTLESRFREGYESEEVVGEEEEEGILEKLSSRKGMMRKLCRHPVFQLSKSVKKNETVSIVNY